MVRRAIRPPVDPDVQRFGSVTGALGCDERIRGKERARMNQSRHPILRGDDLSSVVAL
jgi:hypothetical protein